MHPDELFMRRALDLAERGTGSVSPNPMVGCVIVRNNQIIGEGWHEKFGGPHAEVMALKNVINVSQVAGSTVYVSLEPCAHFGKTPPCADVLIKERVERVVIGCTDPNPLVSGKGIAKLREAGIQVEVSTLNKQAVALNKRFITAQTKGRPYIILKWAETADGFLARIDFSSKWISSELSRQWVHRWRAEEDAVLIGRRTAEHDNASLTVRDWSGRNPIRVVLAGKGKIDPSWKVFDAAAPTWCYSTAETDQQLGIKSIALPEANFLNLVLKDLKSRGINSVLVEGGAQTLNSFIEKGLWDEARIFKAPTIFGAGIPSPSISGAKETERNIGEDVLLILTNPNSVSYQV